MWRNLAIVSVGLLMAVFLVAQNTQTAPSNSASSYYTIPLQAAHQENPVKASPESLARGKKQYGYDCAMCHGKDGAGKGDVAADMKLAMHDETDPATLKARTDGELFYIIKNGKDQMPAEGDRVKVEMVWDMVNYVRSFAKKGAAPADKPAEEKSGEKGLEAKPTDEKAPN
jgi:mono/diheme cytochrome c family protein